MTSLSPGPVRLSPGSLAPNERRFYLEWLLLALLSLAALLWSTHKPVLPAAGQVVYDALHRLNPAPVAEDIVIVAIDDASLQLLGGWPLSRSVYADLLRRLADTHNEPRSIGFDVLFLDPRPEDAEVAAQIRRHNVVMPVELQAQGAGRQVRLPVGEYSAAARHLGHIQVSFESDGVLRGVHLQDQGMSHLVMAMADRSVADLASAGAYRRFRMVDPAVGFETVSLADLLLDRAPLSGLKDKYVLIGATAPSMGDHYPTVHAGRLSAGSPGVQLHASALHALLRDQLIVQAPFSWQMTAGVAAVLIVLVAMLTLGPLAQLLAAGGAMLALLLLSQVLLTSWNFWLDPAPAWIVMALVKPAWAWRRTEMTVHFMRERAKQLDAQILALPQEGDQPRVGRKAVTDTVMRYTRILDQALNALKQQFNALSTIVQGAPNAMLVINEHRRITMLNARMSDWIPAPWMRQDASVDALLQHLGWAAEHNLDALTGKDHYVSSQLKDDDRRHFLLNVIRLSSDSGRSQHLMSLLDITDIRALQAQRERTLELLSHDMRTPVASMLALTPDLDALLQTKLQRHARTLLGMMDDFILSIQAQEHQYSLVETLFDDLMDEAIYQVKDLAQSKAMVIQWQSDDSAAFVMAAPRLLIRVLVNVLVNAIRHGQAGSPIDIRCHTQQGLGGVDGLHCQVRNQIGPAPVAGAPVAQQGFGLGTGFVAEVVRKHHGQVQQEVRGAPGTWAQVTIVLPLALFAETPLS